jgi:hypothetical protein
LLSWRTLQADFGWRTWRTWRTFSWRTLADFGRLRRTLADFGRTWRTLADLADFGWLWQAYAGRDQEERAAHGMLEGQNSLFVCLFFLPHGAEGHNSCLFVCLFLATWCTWRTLLADFGGLWRTLACSLADLADFERPTWRTLADFSGSREVLCVDSHRYFWQPPLLLRRYCAATAPLVRRYCAASAPLLFD